MSIAVRTEAPLEAGETEGMQPEFVRTSDLQKLFGLRHGTTYNLHAAGKIKGVLLRVRGKKSGVRLWSVDSVRAYIASQMTETESEVAA